MKIPFAACGAVEALNGGLFVSPGFGIHPQRVIDSFELIFVTRGRLDMFEEDRHFHLERNQALLLCPGRRHGGLAPYAPDVNFFWVHFRARKPAAGDVAVAVPRVTTVRDPEALGDLFRRFISDQESGILDALDASHLVALMLCMIGEDGAAREEPPSLAVATQRFIEENYSRPITTSSIARALGFNPDYMERVFRSHWKVSVTAALHQKRISMARASLNDEPGKNVNEIAFECGYTDPGYFRRMFKRLSGLTPREFRTLYSRTHINTH